MEFFSHQTNFPFMATRKVWYTLSAVLMIVSIGSFFLRGLNLGQANRFYLFQHCQNCRFFQGRRRGRPLDCEII